MTDFSSSSSKLIFSDSLAELHHTALVLLIIALIFFILVRVAIYELIEKGKIYKIRAFMDNSRFFKTLFWIFSPNIESFKESETPPDDLQNNPVKVVYNNGQASIKHKDEEIIFDKRRALILNYFFNNQGDKKTFHDFNAWLKNNKRKELILDARVFRQEIEEINGRLKKESRYLSGIIQLVTNDLKNTTKANFYKYKVIYKIVIKN